MGAAKRNPNARLIALPVLADRHCGPCSACCTVLHIDELQKLAGVACRHLKHPVDRAEGACGVYGDLAKQPAVCRAWYCLWRRGLGEDSERPDRIGVMLQPSIKYIPGTTTLGISAHEILPGALDQPRTLEYLHRIAHAPGAPPNGWTVYGVRPNAAGGYSFWLITPGDYTGPVEAPAKKLTPGPAGGTSEES